MNEMLVEEYADKEKHIVYEKCKAFTNGKKYYLLNELGYSILIDRELFNMLQQKKYLRILQVSYYSIDWLNLIIYIIVIYVPIIRFVQNFL